MAESTASLSEPQTPANEGSSEVATGLDAGADTFSLRHLGPRDEDIAGMLRQLGLDKDHVPKVEYVNSRLAELTGWQSRGVPGYLPAKAFFACLARRQFPTTIVIRPKEKLEYLPEPDIFHDVFGHVPLHCDPVFAEFAFLWVPSQGVTL